MDFNTWQAKAKQNAGADWNSKDAQNQYQMYQMRQQGQGGDVASKARQRAQAQGVNEDLARFDDATVAVWEKQYDPSCPPNLPYKAYDGSGCVGKPIDSNDAAQFGGWGGDAFSGRRLAGGGGGGGGGGSMSSSTTASSMPGSGGDIESLLQGNLRQLLEGGTRYTPEVMQGILAKIKQQTEGSVRRQQEEARGEAAGRGMARAGATGARLQDIRRGAESAFTGQYADLLTKKVDADMQDKLAAVDRAMQYVDSLKMQLYRQDMTALQREQLRAQIQMAEANIRAQRENLQTSIQGQKDMMGAQFAYGQLGAGTGY